MKSFDAAATRRALPFERLIPALERVFVEGCEVPQRHVHQVSGADGVKGTVLIMPAWRASDLGIKTVTIYPGNARLGLPALHSTYLLYDARTGVPRALIDGDEITSRRTAAASALAAQRLARPDARRLLVLGAGRVARLLPEAYRCALPTIDQVRVWNRGAAGAAAMVDRLRAQGFAAEAVEDLGAAAAEADIVSCATLATEPLVRGAWLRPGSHLDLIGGFTPQMREADDACFAGARLFVDTDEALHKSGDLLGPLARGVFTTKDVQGTLADLCRGSRPGRLGATERTVFKSVGTALEDLAAAMLVAAAESGAEVTPT